MKRTILYFIIAAICQRLTAQPFTWSDQINISHIDEHYPNSPSFCTDGMGNKYLVWRYPSNDAGLYFSWSDGTTWSEPDTIINNDLNIYQDNLAIDSNGVLHLTFEKFYADFYRLYYMKREDGIWSEPIQLSEDSLGSASYSDLVIDNDNHLYVFWSDVALYYKTFDGNSWSIAESISNIGLDHSIKFPSAVVDNDDYIHIVYTVFLTYEDIQTYYQKYDGYQWSIPFNVSRNDTQWAVRPDICIDTSNTPHVVWQQLSENDYDIYYSTQIDSGNWSIPINISNQDQVDNVYPKIQIFNNQPIVFFTGEGPLYYSYRNGSEWPLYDFGLGLTFGSIFDFKMDSADILHLAVIEIMPGWGDVYYISGTSDMDIFKSDYYNSDIFSIENPNPNPFNNEVQIKYTLDRTIKTSVVVYNIYGAEIEKLIDSKILNSGEHILKWNGKNRNGVNVSTGVYIFKFYPIQYKNNCVKVMLIK